MEVNTNKYLIVYHTDPDGYISGNIVCKFLSEKDSLTQKSFIDCVSWNHAHGTEKVEKKISDDTKEIWMVDLTLPDEFMEKYADRIIRIDHHVSAIETKHSWDGKLLKDFSAVSVPNYKGNLSRNQQISACELTWLSLYPGKEIPKYVRLIGRYDVWDHEFDGSDSDFHTYLFSYVSDYGSDNFVCKPSFHDEVTYSNFIKEAIKDGHIIRRAEMSRLKKTCQVMAIKKEIFGRKIAVANTDVKGSSFFDQMVFENPDLEGLMVFRYLTRNSVWEASCYSVKDNFSALDFVQNFRVILPEIISMGGHDKACGFQFKGDPTPFLAVVSNQ